VKELDERIERAVGSPPVRYTPRPGGYSTADRYQVELADGRRVFVKSAIDGNLAAWLRREHEIYSTVSGSFIATMEGWHDDGIRPLLAIEDLSDADWSVDWSGDRVPTVLAALEELAAVAAPSGTPTVREAFADLWDRWPTVAADPESFLSVDLRDQRWLDRALPVILDAVERAPVEGVALCHFDVRSDNLCFRDGKAVLVDWNWASLGNPATDVAAWAPSLAVEGGPMPWEVLPGEGELAAFVAGVWAPLVGLPPPPTAPHVRELQRRQLAVALDWVDRDLL
jgi:phosphotransferase family enzyme